MSKAFDCGDCGDDMAARVGTKFNYSSEKSIDTHDNSEAYNSPIQFMADDSILDAEKYFCFTCWREKKRPVSFCLTFAFQTRFTLPSSTSASPQRTIPAPMNQPKPTTQFL